jgi:hypothetical protein
MTSNKKITTLGVAAIATVMAISAFAAVAVAPAAAQGSQGKCWGEATTTFAQAGIMGEHSSNPGDLDPTSTGREGLGNLKNANDDWAGLLGFLEDASGQELSDCA